MEAASDTMAEGGDEGVPMEEDDEGEFADVADMDEDEDDEGEEEDSAAPDVGEEEDSAAVDAGEEDSAAVDCEDETTIHTAQQEDDDDILEDDEDDDESTLRSQGTEEEDAASTMSSQPTHADNPNVDDDDDDDDNDVKSPHSASSDPQSVAKSSGTPGGSGRKRSPRKAGKTSAKRGGRAPSVKGLTIPFRTVKKAMKLDKDIPIVQNEAAIMTTIAAELFLKSLAKNSFKNARGRGRNTIRYEDVAEARVQDKSLAFLEILLP